VQIDPRDLGEGETRSAWLALFFYLKFFNKNTD
jgi:hypothetical protein